MKNCLATAPTPTHVQADDIKPGTRVMITCGGCIERWGTAYGRLYGRFGTQARIKMDDDSSFETTTRATLKDKNELPTAIGCYINRN